MKKYLVALVFTISAMGALTRPAAGQNVQQMDQLLGIVDHPGGWQNVPVSGGQQAMQQMPQQQMMHMPQQNTMMQQLPQQGMLQQGFNPNMMQGSARQTASSSGFFNPGMTNGGMQRPAMFPAATPSNTNPFTMQNLLKIFLGETPGGGTNPANDSAAIGNARSQCQVANDQASQAEGAEGRTKYGSKSSRNSAAYSAQCHADAARAAADRATGIAAGKSQAANDAAAQARNAAARAQAAADRARYNAATATEMTL